MLGKQSQQPLDAKGEAARFDGARPADSLHESVITPAAANLCIVATGILRVYLEDQPGVITDAAPKRQVQDDALAWDAVLLHHRYELFQFCERRGIDLVATQNIAQRSKRLRGRTGGAVKFAQQVEGEQNLASLLAAPHLPQETIDDLLAAFIVRIQGGQAVQQRGEKVFTGVWRGMAALRLHYFSRV